MKRVGDFGALQIMVRFASKDLLQAATLAVLPDFIEHLQRNSRWIMVWEEWIKDQPQPIEPGSMGDWLAEKIDSLMLQPGIDGLVFSTQEGHTPECSILVHVSNVIDAENYQINVKLLDAEVSKDLDVAQLCDAFMAGTEPGNTSACYVNTSLYTGADQHFPYETYTLYSKGASGVLGDFGQADNPTILSAESEPSILDLQKAVISQHAELTASPLQRLFRQIFHRAPA